MFQGDRRIIAPETTFHDLRACLIEDTDPAELLELLTTATAYRERERSDRQHPWRQVNHWLAITALLRVYTPTALGLGRANQYALVTFRQPLAQEGIVALPVVCQSRNPTVEAAFTRWWERTSDTLAALWRDRLWPRREEASGELLTTTLAANLDPTPLVGLLRAKIEQLRGCIARLNRGVAFPIAAGWVAEVGSRLRYAQVSGQPMDWTSADRNNLERLVNWLHESGITSPFGQGESFRTSALGTLFAHPTNRIEATQLEPLQDDWGRIEETVRTRGLPPDWEQGRHVQDLFFHPLPAGFTFEGWRRDVTGGGP